MRTAFNPRATGGFVKGEKARLSPHPHEPWPFGFRGLRVVILDVADDGSPYPISARFPGVSATHSLPVALSADELRKAVFSG